MARHDMAAVVLVDPVNVRYATGTRNMQIFTARNPARYVFVALDGPVVLFEFAGCAHLAAGIDTVDEVRTVTTARPHATDEPSTSRAPASILEGDGLKMINTPMKPAATASQPRTFITSPRNSVAPSDAKMTAVKLNAVASATGTTLSP